MQGPADCSKHDDCSHKHSAPHLLDQLCAAEGQASRPKQCGLGCRQRLCELAAADAQQAICGPAFSAQHCRQRSGGQLSIGAFPLAGSRAGMRASSLSTRALCCDAHKSWPRLPTRCPVMNFIATVTWQLVSLNPPQAAIQPLPAHLVAWRISGQHHPAVPRCRLCLQFRVYRAGGRGC